MLVAAQMQLILIERHCDNAEIIAGLQSTEMILKEAVGVVRSMTVELSPPVLQQEGLAAALVWLAARMREQHAFHVHVHADNQGEPRSEEVRFLLFESVRELLFNASKHSGQSEATVAMSYSASGFVEITVDDRGKGFSPQQIEAERTSAGSFGLFSIQQRLAFFGGRMTIHSAPGQGTRVTLRAPLDKAGAAEEPAANA